MADLTPSVVAVLFDKTGRVLLLKRANVGRDASLHGKWGFPGGKIEPGEAPYDALLRECAEELGIVLYRHAILSIAPNEIFEFPPYHIRVWILDVLDPFEVVLSTEHTDAMWIDPGEALDLGDDNLAGPGTKHMLETVAGR
jgi:8-oxo-dGTP diphosphatase